MSRDQGYVVELVRDLPTGGREKRLLNLAASSRSDARRQARTHKTEHERVGKVTPIVSTSDPESE